VTAVVAKTAVCARCGATLARDHIGSPLCSPCAAAAPEAELVILPTDKLTRVVGGILLIYSGLRPSRRAPVRQQLARLGISAEPWEVHEAVERLRERGFIIDAIERRRGYRFVDLALVPLTRGWRRRRPAPADQIRLV
jgi:hypothetical protein